MKPRRHYGPRVRTAKQKRASLVALLTNCRAEKLATFTPPALEKITGVPANDCAVALEEARGRRS